MFGDKRRRTRDLAHEILKPIGLDVEHLKEGSRINFERELRRVVDRDQDTQLYDNQKGHRPDEAYEDRHRWTMKRLGR